VRITAAIAAYDAERWIAEAVESVLSQTRPPDEVIVVDDGSTDGTARELARFGDRIRVVSRRNGGCPAAFNTAFATATGDFVALCGSDDVWEPEKLEWQEEVLLAHPEVDVACGDARVFGLEEGRHPRPPGEGVLDGTELLSHLYEGNTICAPTAIVRRDLFERLGPFVEGVRDGEGWRRFNADDYEYWLRALVAGAVFYYDPRELVGYRRHEDNITGDYLHMRRSTHLVHRQFAEHVEGGLSRAVLAEDLFSIGRDAVDAGLRDEGRDAFRASLRYRFRLRPLAWVGVLALPEGLGDRIGEGLVTLKRRLSPAEEAAARWR